MFFDSMIEHSRPHWAQQQEREVAERPDEPQERARRDDRGEEDLLERLRGPHGVADGQHEPA